MESRLLPRAISKAGRDRTRCLAFFAVVVRTLRWVDARLTFLRRRGVLQTVVRRTLAHPSGKSIQGLPATEAGSRLHRTNAGATEETRPRCRACLDSCQWPARDLSCQKQGGLFVDGGRGEGTEGTSRWCLLLSPATLNVPSGLWTRAVLPELSSRGSLQ